MNSKSEAFEEVARRLKYGLKIHTDKELAQILNITPAAYAIRKMKAKIPHERIVKMCQARGLSIDFVFLRDQKMSQ